MLRGVDTGVLTAGAGVTGRLVAAVAGLARLGRFEVGEGRG